MRVPYLAVAYLSWCICCVRECVCGNSRTKRWMSLSALIGRAVSSCQVGSSRNIHSVRVCHHAMSLQCHGTGIGGAAACVIKMYEDTPVSLSSSSLIALFLHPFSLQVAPRHGGVSPPGMRPKCVSKKCRGSLRLSFPEPVSATKSNEVKIFSFSFAPLPLFLFLLRLTF